MAQKISRLCDPCLSDDVETDAAQLVVNLGAGFVSLDLCDHHAALLAKPMLDAVAAYAVAVDDGPTLPSKRKSGRRGGRRPTVHTPQGGDRSYAHLCPVCSFGVESKSAIHRHVQVHHGAGLLALLGDTCPLCGVQYPGRGRASLATHVQDVHEQPSLGHAAWAAAGAGDPYGVAAAARQRAATAGA
jgi:hypothetical protein